MQRYSIKYLHTDFKNTSKRPTTRIKNFHLKKKKKSQAVVVHAFNPSTWEAEAGRFLSLRPAWFTE
jgi:hypothetical protein